MRPDYVGLGGFDSHTLPPSRARVVYHAMIAVLLTLWAVPALLAQQALPPAIPVAPPVAVRTGPPVSPGRAFFYSALVPGLGQAALDRKYAGAAFFFIEAFSLALTYRTADDLRLARGFAGDSVPLTFTVDANGNSQVATRQAPRYSQELVRTRKLQLEDWLAVVIFNHLIAGADAYVAANLWDLPQHLGKMRAFPVAGGAGVAVSVGFR